MANFERAEHYDIETGDRRSLMTDVWRQMQSVGLMWGAVVDGRNALSGYERSLRLGFSHPEAAERALNYFAGPRTS
jgi:hypothetical protein